MRKQFLLPVFLLSFALMGCKGEDPSAASASKKPIKPFPIKRIASRVADRLPNIQLNRIPFGDNIATNSLKLFIDSLDFDHSYFLATDITEFQQQATLLDDQVKAGDTAFAQTVFDRFKECVTNRTAYVNKLLDEGFDLDVEETYHWKRTQQPWAGNIADWNGLWRKKIKNEYVARVAAMETEPEPKDEEEKQAEEPLSTHTVDAIEVLSPIEFIRERYKQYEMLVENNFDTEMILQRYLSSFTRSYDPHSDYLSPRSVEDFDIQMRLSLVGVGAMLRSEDGAAKILRVIPGGPADADGRLKAGDKIIAVSQGDEPSESILHWPLSKAVRLIRGEIGTKVVLTIIPAENTAGTRTKKIDLIRAEVKLEESAAKAKVHELDRTAGTVRISQVILPEFYADFSGAKNGDTDARRCSVDIHRILKGIATNNINGIIIDLRNNGGGSLTEAIDITGLFIPIGPIVQVRDRRGVAILPDGDPTTLYKGPLIVLVNRLSASASEILAAALQDYGRAVIVGDKKTHGKGSVQTVIPLSKRGDDDLGSLKVTTASFYRIAGGSTQLRGVTPDIILPSLLDSLELGEEFLPNALPWSQVRKAYYRTWRPSVKLMLPELQKRSTARTAESPEFQNYLAKRDRIQKQMETPLISLKLSDRIEKILAEQELEGLQETLLAGAEETAEDKEKKDPVLDETLQILADMVELSAAGAELTRK